MGDLVTAWQDGQGKVYAQIFTETGTSLKQLKLGYPYATPGRHRRQSDGRRFGQWQFCGGLGLIETRHNIQFDIWNAAGTAAITLNQVAS